MLPPIRLILAWLSLASTARAVAVQPSWVPTHTVSDVLLISGQTYQQIMELRVTFISENGVPQNKSRWRSWANPTWKPLHTDGIVLSVPAFQAPGTSYLQLIGTDISGSSLSSPIFTLQVYQPPSNIQFARQHCPRGMCLLEVTLHNPNKRCLPTSLLVRLSQSSALPNSGVSGLETNEYTFHPEQQNSCILHTLSVKLQHLSVGQHGLSIAANGVHWVTSSQVLTVFPYVPLRVCFVFAGDIGDYGWTYGHNRARIALEQEYSQTQTITTSFSSANSDTSATAILETFQKHADAGCELVVGCSWEHGPAMLQLAPQYNTTKWLHISGQQATKTVSTGFARMYQARYLSGVVAGGQLALDANPSCVAYMAAFKNPEVLRQINSFVLGCRFANPTCAVKVLWINTWRDEWVERNGAAYSYDTLGCRYFTQHSNSLIAQRVFSEKGGLGIGFNVNAREYLGDNILVSAEYNWVNIYDRYVKQVLFDSWIPYDEFWDKSTSAVSVSQLSPKVGRGVASLFFAESMRIAAAAGGGIFCGQLRTDTGNPVPGSHAGHCLTDQNLLQMMWLVNGATDTGDYIAPENRGPNEDSSDAIVLALSAAAGGFVLITCCMMGVLWYLRWKAESDHRKEQEALQFLHDTGTAAQASLLQTLCHDLKGTAVNSVQEIENAKESATAGNFSNTIEFLDRAAAECVHLQRSVRALQMKSDMATNVFRPTKRQFSSKGLMQMLSDRYPQACLERLEVEWICADEDGIYHVLHNAVRNGVCHGEVDAEVTLAVLLQNKQVVFVVINKAGPKHSQAVALQDLHGENFLLRPKVALVDLSVIGNSSSDFRGCVDMLNTAQALNCYASLIFKERTVEFRLVLPESGTVTLDHGPDPVILGPGCDPTTVAVAQQGGESCVIAIQDPATMATGHEGQSPGNSTGNRSGSTLLPATSIELKLVPEEDERKKEEGVVHGISSISGNEAATLPMPAQVIPHSFRLNFLYADDHNGARVQGLKLAKELGVPIQEPKWSMEELKGNAFRDEPHLRICGRNPNEVSITLITEFGKRWAQKPTMMIFDQNLDFGHSIVFGTDLARSLRAVGFPGVILIRSGNDSADDEKLYLGSGADAMLPKTAKMDVLLPELNNWCRIAMDRAQASYKVE